MNFKEIIHKLKRGVFSSLSIVCFVILTVVFVVSEGQLIFAYLNSKKPHRITREYIRSVLQTLPFQEKQDLDALFRHLFFNEGFAYTLFEARPVAYTAYFKREPINNILCGRISEPVRAWWRTWEKYKNNFPMEKFALITREDCKHNTVNIYLVNKKLLMSTLHKARPNTKWVLNSGKNLIELEKIFNDFAIGELPNYTEILGVLLGFGENNANLFYRREIMEGFLIPDSQTLGRAAVTGDLINLTEKLDQLNNSLKVVRTHKRIKPFEFVHFVGFMADSETEETKQVLRTFSKAQDKICRGYAEGSFLEVTLERLTAVEEP